MNQVISTQGFPPAKRVAAWNEAACTQLSPMSVQPVDASQFSGHMSRSEFPHIRAVDIACGGAVVQRSHSHVVLASEPVFMLDLQLEGESLCEHAGRVAHLRPGDFVLTDSTRPHRVVFNAPVVMRILRMPAATLRRYLGCPELIVGIRVAGDSGYRRIASHFLRKLGSQEGIDTLAPEASHLENASMELLASACSQLREARTERSSLGTLHRFQAIEHIEKSLHRPDLTPSAVAMALRITPRYLHRLFSGDGETVGRYILKRRLERCAQQLSAPLHDCRHISDIAFSGGFSTVAHFCRTFRKHFSLSPGEFREHARKSREQSSRNPLTPGTLER